MSLICLFSLSSPNRKARENISEVFLTLERKIWDCFSVHICFSGLFRYRLIECGSQYLFVLHVTKLNDYRVLGTVLVSGIQWTKPFTSSFFSRKEYKINKFLMSDSDKCFEENWNRVRKWKRIHFGLAGQDKPLRSEHLIRDMNHMGAVKRAHDKGNSNCKALSWEELKSMGAAV